MSNNKRYKLEESIKRKDINKSGKRSPPDASIAGNPDEAERVNVMKILKQKKVKKSEK